MKGTIKEIIDSDSLVTIIINQGTTFEGIVNLDHRMYFYIIEDKGNIIGKEIEYDGEQIYFKEDE